MHDLIQQIIDQIIIKKSLLNNYPKPGVVFLAIDGLFNDAVSRKKVSDAVLSSISSVSFDSIAGIASRGYLFSGMIANRFADKGEYFIQKVKSRGDSHFVQIDTETEYSSDALQVLKNTIQKGKKYLLVDDLIATGGSLIAAIKLIRECGGVVDSVFAMTELLDFNAREKLKKEGVELISLLKFTNEDLQKLLCIQEDHEKNQDQPITYKLSCYEKEEHLTSVMMNRWVDINSNKSKNKYAKKGILFKDAAETRCNQSIDFYNQGCSKSWNVDPKKLGLNNFKIFATGDSFSVISPETNVKDANVTIHVGMEHDNYSPLVLLHEALQLCRTAYEHGAECITVALPENFHPILHHNDFNLLLMRLFKVSGVKNIYYYDKNYTGALDETHRKVTMPLAISKQSDAERYQISRDDLLKYLHFTKDFESELTLDEKVEHFMRKNYLNRAWSKLETHHSDMRETLFSPKFPSELSIPEFKNQTHILLCCSANRPLAEKIAKSLHARGEVVKLVSIQGKGEQAMIPTEANICGATVTIVQSTRPNPDDIEASKEYQKNGAVTYLFETAVIARQARLRGADRVNLINSYQFGARSDKAENNPKGKTGSYVQQNGMLLEAAGISQVITAECHDVHTLSGTYTHKKIQSSIVPALTVLSTNIVNEWLKSPNHQGQLRLVIPDEGAAKRTKELTQQLQAILGKQLCESRVLGEKQRGSHADDSALINELHAGSIGINPQDKYLITDDETATGTTLCQAVTNLKKSGAKDITVAVVHNNMPLDWLERQLCLTRFLYLGVNDLHFSDTQEMGSLAKSYDDLVEHYVKTLHLSSADVEAQVFAWFKKNISKDFSDQSDGYIRQEFTYFKSLFHHLEAKIKIHSLATEFANKVARKACVKTFYTSDNKSLLFQNTSCNEENTSPDKKLAQNMF